MLRTIAIGSCVSVQGILIRTLANGKMTVKVDDKVYSGTPINRKA